MAQTTDVYFLQFSSLEVGQDVNQCGGSRERSTWFGEAFLCIFLHGGEKRSGVRVGEGGKKREEIERNWRDLNVFSS